MKSRLMVCVLSFATSSRADELIFQYEGEVSPSTSGPEWITGNPCDQQCTESIQSGHLVFSWPHDPASGDHFVNYHHDIGIPPDVPESPFWVEWRAASNNAIHISTTQDATFVVDYHGIHNLLDMYGDAVISRDGGTIAFNLPLDQFRTFRFETISDDLYCYWYDGILFLCNQNDHSKTGLDYIQVWGHGGVDANQSPGPIINRWDYVRYGRVTTGEAIVVSNPHGGQLDAAQFSNLDRFTVTFDQPNYIYVADITVEVLSNQIRDREVAVSATTNHRNPDQLQQASNSAHISQLPRVIATRRQDNSPPETVEIVLDRPIPIGQTTRFTFNTGATTPQIVEYTLEPISKLP